MAIISDDRGEEKVYSVGDPITAGRELHSVRPDRAILNNNGTLEELKLPRESEGTAAPQTEAFLEAMLKAWQGPLLLDADALNLLAENPNLWNSLPENTILTPHPGEMARLSGKSDVQNQRLELAGSYAGRLRAGFLGSAIGAIDLGVRHLSLSTISSHHERRDHLFGLWRLNALIGRVCSFRTVSADRDWRAFDASVSSPHKACRR